jgi:hypothetical protein
MRGSPSPVNGAGSFLVEEKVRGLERAGNGQDAVCLLQPCSLGIRGFESHPPHHNRVCLFQGCGFFLKHAKGYLI